MTPAARRERGTLLCRQLAGEIEKLAPTGIGKWARTWAIVSEADASFMIALAAWEATGSEDDLPPLRTAYHAVLEAWRRAATEFERQGVER